MYRQFLKSARLISALTLASRVLGLVRDMACGYAFGVGGVWSAFSIAFQVPNLFRRLFGEGALSAASIPVLTEALAREGTEAVDRLAGRLVGALLAVLFGAVILAEAVVGVLYLLYGDRPDSGLTLMLTALLLPYMLLVCMVAALGGVQNVFSRFASPAIMPIVLNVFMIGAAVISRGWMPDNLRAGVVVLALAVLVAGVAQLIWQWVATRRCGLRLPVRLDTGDPRLRRIGITMIPMIAGLGAVQINVLLDALIAWWFVEEQIVPGATPERVGPAVLYFAQRLYQFPLGVFAIALATAIFPALSRQAADEDLPGLGRTLSRGFRVATFEALPCLIGLILIREPLVEVLFKRGQFASWSAAVDRVSMALCMYALGIWAYALNQLVVRAFYSLHDARTPLLVSVRMVLLNVALNLLLVQTPLKEAGLALATSLCASIQVIILVARFNRRVPHLAWGRMMRGVWRSVAAALLMGLAIWLADHYALRDQHATVRLAVMVTVGVVSYLMAAAALRCSELRDMLRR